MCTSTNFIVKLKEFFSNNKYPLPY